MLFLMFYIVYKQKYSARGEKEENRLTSGIYQIIGSSGGKICACSERDPTLIPGSGISLGEGIGYLLSILEFSWWLSR